MSTTPTSTVVDHAPPTGQTASLAALAVSLAYARREDRACTRELLADRPGARELRAARSLLRRWRLEDPERQHRAVQLLDRAIAQCPDAPTHAGDTHRWVTEWGS